MNNLEQSNKGYVYILEVKDIVLPVCKIGMTTRTPFERCNEINRSSTGDFLWGVANYIAVNDCRKLESLIHKKLSPMKQKKREFFNLSADDANKAIISILENQSEIIKVDIEQLPENSKRTSNRKYNFKAIDSDYSELLKLFTLSLNIKGRPFGQLNKPVFGISDGNEGVQWNLAISTKDNTARIGVNLEGMKYKNWPISKFITSELNSPEFEQVSQSLTSPDNIFIRFSRDAWQVTSRPQIKEEHLGGKEFAFSNCSVNQWILILTEAITCLNGKMNHCGRSKQTVTLSSIPKNGSQTRIMEVSPHLTIWSPLNLQGDIQENINKKINELMPIYQWVSKQSK